MSDELLPQLLMRRPHLRDLPEAVIPAPYTLHRCDRLFSADEESGLATVLAAAFPESVWSESRVNAVFIGDESVRTTFYIAEGSRIAATATVRLDPAYPESGYLHWVAVLPGDRGKRLGRIVSLAVLHEFAALGRHDTVLNTDDARLPAIRTYLDLGFVPEFAHASHEARWAAIRTLLPL